MKRQFFLRHDQLLIEPDHHYGEVYASKVREYILHQDAIFLMPLEVYREPVSIPQGYVLRDGLPAPFNNPRFGEWVLKNGRHRALAALALGHRYLWCEEVEKPVADAA